MNSRRVSYCSQYHCLHYNCWQCSSHQQIILETGKLIIALYSWAIGAGFSMFFRSIRGLGRIGRFWIDDIAELGHNFMKHVLKKEYEEDRIRRELLEDACNKRVYSKKQVNSQEKGFLNDKIMHHIQSDPLIPSEMVHEMKSMRSCKVINKQPMPSITNTQLVSFGSYLLA